MHLLSVRKRIPRLAAVMFVLAASAGSLATAMLAPPASAVPVDGLYTGTIFSGSTHAPLTVQLSTSAPNRGPVMANITIGSGATVQCFGSHDLASTFTLPSGPGGVGSGGVASAAPRGLAAVHLTGKPVVG